MIAASLDSITAIAGIVGVVITLAGVFVGGVKLYMRNREALRQRVRQALCRHEWKDVHADTYPLVLMTTDRQRCDKCGARR